MPMETDLLDYEFLQDLEVIRMQGCTEVWDPTVLTDH